jgi:3-hydroxybutyryl-CoA dehydratase
MEGLATGRACGLIRALQRAVLHRKRIIGGRPRRSASEEDDLSAPNALNGFFLEDLELGMTAVFGKTITEADILMFAGVSGDTNPLHLNEAYARGTMFEGRIVHGMLTSSLISTVIGTRLPGPGCVYISQSLKFLAPVRIGDTVEARATVVALQPDKRRVTLETVCTVGDREVLRGEALIMVPQRPRAAA